MILIPILAKQFACGIRSDMPCYLAYDLFVKCYKKQFNIERMERFCGYFDYVKKCKNCNVTSILDDPPHHNMKSSAINVIKQDEDQLTILEKCQQSLCAWNDVLTPLTQIHKSVDLTEAGLITPIKNQLQCGMCWAFGTVCALENAVLRDESPPAFWNQQNLNVSELFLGVNTRGNAKFCEGGDFYFAINYINATNQTLELATNFPYTQANVNAYKTIFQANQSVDPKISVSDYYQPFDQISNSQNISIPLVILHNQYYSETVNFDTTAIKAVKSYLSRGIAVVGGMRVAANEAKFFGYGSGVLQQSCSGSLDHQVVFVGYGRKDGFDVWMMRNSYGTNWGHQGYFYVPIGQNSFCTEQEAEIIFPKHFTDGLYADIGSHSSRQTWQMDSDSNELIQNDGSISNADFQLSVPLIAGIAAAIVVIAIATATGVVMCKKKSAFGKRGVHLQ